MKERIISPEDIYEKKNNNKYIKIYLIWINKNIGLHEQKYIKIYLILMNKKLDKKHWKSVTDLRENENNQLKQKKKN